MYHVVQGDVLLRVPVKLMLSTVSALKCSVIGPLLRAHSFLQVDSVSLALHILWERLQGCGCTLTEYIESISIFSFFFEGDGSFFAPYIRSLPQSFTVPLFFSPEAMGTLRCSIWNMLLLLEIFCFHTL